MIPFTREQFVRSVCWLAIDINLNHRRDNQLTEKARQRHEYMFSDHGVPKPRPCTALAWASLCAFGPIQGFAKILEDGSRLHHPWNPTKGFFVIPFIPALNANDPQDTSLSRASSIHNRMEDGTIDWGPLWIADATTGQLMWQSSLDHHNVKEWYDQKPGPGWFSPDSLTPDNQCDIPPIWAFPNERWQFGLIQKLHSMAIPLRFPFEELAKNGIPLTEPMELKLHVRRLMIRFSKVEAAQAWANAYCEAMKSALDFEACKADAIRFDQELQEKKKKSMVKDLLSTKKSTQKKRKLSSRIDPFAGIENLNLNPDSNESK